MSDEREEVARELRRVREAAEAEPVPARTPEDVLGSARPTAKPAVPEPEQASAAGEDGPAPPDGTALNQVWDTRRALRERSRLSRLLLRLIAPAIDGQLAFNSRQVQFDNELKDFVIERLEAVHRQYDHALGIHGRHMEDIDERHLILQEELVAHVHDLVRRIDLTLSEAERTRLSLEAELRELRARVGELEKRLGGDRD
jgi:hypothetical protein